MLDLVIAAMEVGRVAGPLRFHTEVLATRLGWDGTGVPAVALGSTELVPGAADATVLLVPDGDRRVAVYDLTGVPRTPRMTLADEGAADLVLPEGSIGVHDADVPRAIAVARIVLAADAVGAATAALEAAVEHVKVREQFGAPLGIRQAVQHRCADMLLDVTMAADAVHDAAATLDRGGALVVASAAKAGALPRCQRTVASAQQLAGGKGILLDAPFPAWFRRVALAALRLGDARTLRAEVARALLAQPGDRATSGS